MTKPTPFIQRTRRHRRNRFVSERWKIRTDPDGKGLFRCRHLLPGTPRWQEEGLEELTQTHADVRFLSRHFERDGRLYLGRLATVEHQVGVLLEQWVESQLDRIVECWGVPWSEVYPYGQGQHPALAILANKQGEPRTVWEWMADAWASVTPQQWEALPVTVGETLKLDHRLGVEFIAVWPVDNMTPDVIAQGLERFWSAGEKPRSEPVDWPAHRAKIQQEVDRQVALYRRLAAA